MTLFGFLGPVGDAQEAARLLTYLGPAASPAAAAPAPPAACVASQTHTIDGVTIALQGGPVWLRNSNSAMPASPAALLQAYRTQGVGFLDQLAGRFALAVLDPAQRQAILAIDPMGVERMTYCTLRGGIVFGCSAEQVARSPGVAAGLNHQAIFDYLLLHIVPAPATIYRGVQKLRPGTAAVFRDGSLAIRRYWRPGFVENGAAPFADLKAQLHDSLRAAVESCAPDDRTGAFLSGGLDSSSVSGMLARVRPAPRTFSIGFGVESYDELGYARIANQHFRANGHEYHVTPEDIVDAFPRIALAYDEPFGNSSAVPTYFCAKFAREHGIEHLLAGDGGDELFGGNERYVKQQVFERYFLLPRWLRAGLLEPLARAVSADSSLVPLRKLRSYIDQATVRLPERFESWNLIYREGAPQVIDPQFLGSVDPRAPFAVMQQVFDEVPDSSLLNRMLFYDWHYTLADNDLRKVNTMCELAGMRVSYPMLDPRVIETSLRVPSAVKIAGGELRAFYKRAMADFLPTAILEKHKHGFGLPFGVWLKTHAPLRDLIFGHMDALRRRGIVHRDFLDGIAARHRDGDASFYGYAIWDMAMLDAWLSSHGMSS